MPTMTLMKIIMRVVVNMMLILNIIINICDILYLTWRVVFRTPGQEAP